MNGIVKQLLQQTMQTNKAPKRIQIAVERNGKGQIKQQQQKQQSNVPRGV